MDTYDRNIMSLERIQTPASLEAGLRIVQRLAILLQKAAISLEVGRMIDRNQADIVKLQAGRGDAQGLMTLCRGRTTLGVNRFRDTMIHLVRDIQFSRDLRHLTDLVPPTLRRIIRLAIDMQAQDLHHLTDLEPQILERIIQLMTEIEIQGGRHHSIALAPLILQIMIPAFVLRPLSKVNECRRTRTLTLVQRMSLFRKTSLGQQLMSHWLPRYTSQRILMALSFMQ